MNAKYQPFKGEVCPAGDMTATHCYGEYELLT